MSENKIKKLYSAMKLLYHKIIGESDESDYFPRYINSDGTPGWRKVDAD